MNRNLSNSPILPIHDEDQAILECKKKKRSLKDLQMWFAQMTFDAYRQIIMDLYFVLIQLS